MSTNLALLAIFGKYFSRSASKVMYLTICWSFSEYIYGGFSEYIMDISLSIYAGFSVLVSLNIEVSLQYILGFREYIWRVISI